MKMISETDEKTPRKLTIGGIFIRIGIILFILIVALLILAYTVMYNVIHGPSKTARDVFVTTCMETSFAKLFPPIYLTDAEIAEIQKDNTVIETNEATIAPKKFDDPEEDVKDIEVVDVFGSTYKGYMMIVKDPSRVVVGAPEKYDPEVPGFKLLDMIKQEGAVAGINGGGFVDLNGVGNGGTPLGFVVKDNKILSSGGASCIVGFDVNNVLHVGVMTEQQLIDKQIRDAVSFGPTLIVNSKPIETVGNAGGLNPRTAVGQRADGSVLLLVIDGRQPHSLGASFKDIIDVMLEFGAVNAGNLDGGSSSMLYYNGEMLSTCASLYGPRNLPSAFLVK